MTEGVPDEVLAAVREQIPPGRLGRSLEVARLVLFLCQDASSHIPGG